MVFNGNGSGTAVSFNRAAMGVNPYAAPEARQLAFSPASDVYSLAASLLAVMGQAAPEVTFARGTPRVGLLKEAPELYQVLQKATDLEPKRRYPNGERFARALEGLLGRLPAEAEARLAKPKRRRGPIGLIGMMSLAVLLGLFAYGVWRFWPTPQQAEALPVPVPAGVISIPRGDVVISGFNIDFVAEEGVASVAVERGEQPLAQSEQPRLLLQRNGAVLSGQRVEPLQEGRFQIRFALPENPAGMYRVVAQLNGTEAQQARYFAPTENADLTAISTTVELDDLRADGLQVETQRYPDITSYFAVVTLDGAAAKLLGSFDVEVFQDGQPVTDFYLEPVNTAKEPVTVAVVVDVSGSMRGEPIELARQGAASFVRQLGANDTACLYTFATLVRLVVECTNDKAAVITAIEGLQTIDDTALYDALVRVTNDIAQRSGRLAIVVLSDGADTKSQATIAQALEGVRTSSIPVYTIGLLSEQFDGSVLRTLAEGADAIYLEAPQPEAIATLYAQVEQQLASQYRITFRSLFPERRSGEITIRVKQGDEVIEIKREFSVQ
jgi:Mg-chelatase subunit ChlD